MTPQPDYVPVRPADRVRPTERLPVPDSWEPDRPGDIRSVRQPWGTRMGSPGPDQGFGLMLARRFVDRLQLAEGEHAEDAVAGCLAVALKRAALFGRAPVIHDFELAYTLWGFLGDAPKDLVTARKPLFEAASHHYEDQRAIADAVPESTLRLKSADIASALAGDWRQLIQL
jgi:hypothetical protein